jgi:hypothetical protein
LPRRARFAIVLPSRSNFIKTDAVLGDEFQEFSGGMSDNTICLFAAVFVDLFGAERPDQLHARMVVWGERVRDRDHTAQRRGATSAT